MGWLAIGIKGQPRIGGSLNAGRGRRGTQPHRADRPALRVVCASCGKLSKAFPDKDPKGWKRVNALRVVCDVCSAPGAAI